MQCFGLCILWCVDVEIHQYLFLVSIFRFFHISTLSTSECWPHFKKKRHFTPPYDSDFIRYSEESEVSSVSCVCVYVYACMLVCMCV
jgi:hypothetical protein